MKRAVVIRAGRINVRSATGTNNKITVEVFEKKDKKYKIIILQDLSTDDASPRPPPLSGKKLSLRVLKDCISGPRPSQTHRHPLKFKMTFT
jgi:hypothetical protein